MLLQKTINRECNLSGSGFIYDQPVQVTLSPAGVDEGIRFVRTDLEGAPEISVHPRAQVSVEHCTTLQAGSAKVAVVEHLLAACAALGVTNLKICLDGQELPTCDGSSLPWAEAMIKAGIADQDKPAREIMLQKPVMVTSADGAAIIALPSSEPVFEYILDYSLNPEIGCSFASVKTDSEDLISSLLPARTFIMEDEAREALKAGKIRSTDEKLGLVIHQGQPPILRMPGELARHKILDMIGDLYVLGSRVRARFIGVKSGHKLNAQMVRELSARYP
jgi:UDP-3-O-[3-hydroxymyristoyl] N-acetylglucosamine deacetylase / 3-hydroxyacyl-[acyl-carrier-protein] dehydratase